MKKLEPELIFVSLLVFSLIGIVIIGLIGHTITTITTPPPPQPPLFAVLVSTNLVSQPCPCGFCDPSRNIAVPEHIGSIGHDLRLEVSTNYLPVVSK